MRLYADSEIQKIIDYLTANGPATRAEIAVALGKTAGQVRENMRDSPRFRAVATRQTRPNVNERVWAVALDTGDLVSWTHTAPNGRTVTLTGIVVGGDWDGLHVLSNGSRFAVRL
jgi:hypothetical protein